MNAQVDFWQNPGDYLLHVVESDDVYLEKHADAVWFQAVKYISINWKFFHTPAVKYYESLFLFNRDKITSYRDNLSAHQPVAADADQARLELMFRRPTCDAQKTPALKEPEQAPEEINSFNPELIRPGIVPIRQRGRKPIDFFCLLPAYIAVQLMGEESTPEAVCSHLNNNPSLARACGFTPGGQLNPLPSLRLLQQFDQIMTENGIWTLLQLDSIKRNIENDLIDAEKNLVHDTTHHIAYSGFETVEYSAEDENKFSKK